MVALANGWQEFSYYCKNSEAFYILFKLYTNISLFAKMIARDGEGAAKLMEVEVSMPLVCLRLVRPR